MFVECFVGVWLTYRSSFLLPFIFITLYGVVYVQLADFSIGDWKDIYTSCYHHNQIRSINLSRCYHIFSVVGCLICLLHHILLLIAYTFRENMEFVFIIFVQFMMSANSRIRFGLNIVFVYLYITPSYFHHCANLSEDIEHIKCLSDIFCRVCE